MEARIGRKIAQALKSEWMRIGKVVVEGEGLPDAAAEGAVGSHADQHSEGWAVSRRVLLKAGWSVPVIMTVAPAVAFAASGSPIVTGLGGASTTGGGTPPPTVSVGAPQSTAGAGAPSSTAGGGSPSGISEQQAEGPQPARINRGFTG